ncbi:hypothetical protein ABB37_07731 [Leptomonas pyrrhocoris]|uniref:Uncharacterized protein n=1 Tax=Leptomonas pyrrhocoris TaxID=157538 RepID=A0A0M9FUP8_LEPPY|nr:hypothetical protein ABB37_07731 [Leptomonas pyrrhocoris]KPA76393.1 hypothetical protein ABB37_07731 [Leptomonas pyrrhocoris]|eukprot:XP_015654832.1 hypothetical protein ABB37_07731 [Leptomonas pyrrhocoris]
MYTMRSAALRLTQAVLVVALLAATQVAHGQLQGLLVLQMKDWIIYTPKDIKSRQISVTYDSTAKLCFSSGGVPASDPTTSINNQMMASIKDTDAGAAVTFFTGASAEPSAENPNKCCDARSCTSPTLSSDSCTYRWRYGFYDMYSYAGEPGTAFWQGLYANKGHVLNDYEQFVWNTTGSLSFPRGQYYMINSVGTRSLVRMDSPMDPENNNPNPVDKYMVVCEVQLYPQHPPTTSRKPQPTFVNCFKRLTWAQSHWWVIFLIIALVLLVLLFAVIAYCCITATKPKEEPLIHAMVLRERMGTAYVLADAIPKSSNGSKDPKLPNGAYTQQQMSVEQQQQQHQEAQRRLGRGFNPQEPRQNPEDMTMGAAGIFGRGGRNQYGDGNMVDSDGRQKGDDYYANVRGGCLHEDEVKRMEQQQHETASAVDSVTAPKRRSSRHSRGRTVSQTFEDVDVPQAGEISELNVDL